MVLKKGTDKRITRYPSHGITITGGRSQRGIQSSIAAVSPSFSLGGCKIIIGKENFPAYI
jgi:hypothetical protein